MGAAFIKKDTVEESVIQALKTAKIAINLTDKDGNPLIDLITYLEDARKSQTVLAEFEEWLVDTNDIIWGKDTISYSIYKKLQKIKMKHGLPWDAKRFAEEFGTTLPY